MWDHFKTEALQKCEAFFVTKIYVIIAFTALIAFYFKTPTCQLILHKKGCT